MVMLDATNAVTQISSGMAKYMQRHSCAFSECKRNLGMAGLGRDGPKPAGHTGTGSERQNLLWRERERRGSEGREGGRVTKTEIFAAVQSASP